MEKQYYDGTELLSQLDINGNKPEIYMCTANRTAGKTTYFARMVTKRFLKQGKKFISVQRFDGQLKGVAEAFFKDIEQLFFRGMEMTQKLYKDIGYAELFLDGVPCGYAMAINTADKIKRISHFFSDADCMLFDEFQSETNHYCPGEVDKFMSLHTSVARGRGKHVRYVPVYMVANPVTLLNPYYNTMDISPRLRKSTRFLKGAGFVLEQGYVEEACKAQQESGFNQAFAKSKYAAYSAEGVYLNENTAFICKPSGRSKYLFTLKYKTQHFGIYEFPDLGFIYCSPRINPECPNKLAITTEDHNVNYVMLQKNELLIGQLRFLFEKGAFRFADLSCKEAALKMLSYY